MEMQIVKINEHALKIDEQTSRINEQKQMIDEMQEEHSKKTVKMREVHKKEINEVQKQGIRNAVARLRDIQTPEQEIKTRIFAQYQISEEQMQKNLNFEC